MLSKKTDILRPLSGLIIGSLCGLMSINICAQAPSMEEARKKRAEQMKQAVEESNTIIRFYGKVVDQENKPVSGATVKMRVGETVALFKESVSVLTFTSDSKGEFEVPPTKGHAIEVESIEKEGYELPQDTKRSFAYKLQGRPVFSPDPSNPVVFTLFEKAKAAPLVHVNKSRIGIPCDGTPTDFDLLTGAKTQEGDLRITLTRNPIDIDKRKPFNWKAKIEIKGGGMLISGDNSMFSAPESGYYPSIELNMPADKTDWSPKYVKNFYIKIRDKYYGRINIHLSADYQPPPTGFSFEVWVNGEGTRNLQFDYSKEITPEAVEQLGLEQAVQAAKSR